MLSLTPGRRRAGKTALALLALAALIGASALVASSCAHEQSKDKPAFARRGGGPGSQSGQGSAPEGQGGPGGPPPDGAMGGAGGLPPDGQGGPGGPDGAGGPQAKEPTKIAATYSVVGRSEKKSGVDYKASAADSSAVYVGQGGSLELSKTSIAKSGKASNNDESSFYGVNAALLVGSGGALSLSDAKIVTSGEGANAIVATGEGTKVVAKGLTIRTSANGSRGLHATMKGSIEAEDVDIETKGEHCAALATDRGEGTIAVTGGALSTAGEGSPVIYSTGEISATKVIGRATGSEAAVVEGKNSIALVDSELYGAKLRGVMLYQSFSGDAGTGTASFTMTGGALEAAAGPLVYVTNTDAVLSLKAVKAKAASGILFKAGSDRWGRKGSNGGHLRAVAESQELSGDIVVESGSSISLELAKGSSLSGKIQGASLSIGEGCSWKVTGDSRLVAIALPESDIATLVSRIADGGHQVSYDQAAEANAWLGGKSYDLAGGGKLAPAK
jgi:hypothetical protein